MSTRQRILICILAFSLAIIFSVPCLSSTQFVPGMKVGINLSKQDFISGVQEFGGYPKYRYPLDLLLGVYCELQFSRRLSIMVELIYAKTTQKVALWASVENVSYFLHEARYAYFRLPLLLKVQTGIFAKPYFLIGPDVGYLRNADYLTYGVLGRDYYIDRRRQKTENLPTIDTSIDFGLGKKFEVRHVDVILETRVSLGLTVYDIPLVSSWKNKGIQFVLGVQLK